jgi:hypothetical protein
MWTLLIANSGSILCKSRMFLHDLALSMAELSIQSLMMQQQQQPAYVDAVQHHHPQYTVVLFGPLSNITMVEV